MSVNTSPLTSASWLPSPSSRPAAPRWVNVLSENSTRCPYEIETLPGSRVQPAYGQVPFATNWHSPWVDQPFGPVLVYPAWISEKPSGDDGVSHVAYWKPIPRNATSCTWSPVTSFSSA